MSLIVLIALQVFEACQRIGREKGNGREKIKRKRKHGYERLEGESNAITNTPCGSNSYTALHTLAFAAIVQRRMK